MKTIYDLVNFNADASCLSADVWLRAMRGGQTSPFARWLQLYIDRERRLTLGLTGSTVADLAYFNPESLQIIRENPDIFQIIIRPFAHDVGLLRTFDGFQINLELGRCVLESEFGSVLPLFLPPEFMLTVEQIGQLHKAGIKGTFVNAERYPRTHHLRIPAQSYRLSGSFGIELACIPVSGALTRSYLSGHDHLDASDWNREIAACPLQEICIWRDGESWLLVPEGLEREAAWLDEEDPSFSRQFLTVPTLTDLPRPEQFGPHHYRSYPLHSLSAWLREMRMLRFIRRIEEIEKNIHNLDPEAVALWLLTINSDILSSVEKDGIQKRMRKFRNEETFFDVVLHREDRGFEGEEYLAILEEKLRGGNIDWLYTSSSAHMQKARARVVYSRRLIEASRSSMLANLVDARSAAGYDQEQHVRHTARVGNSGYS